MTTKLQLFPHIEPFNTGFLNCSEHNIYYEECGNKMESRLYFFMVGRVEAEVRMLGVFLIQHITEL
jgi:hypothetical protein